VGVTETIILQQQKAQVNTTKVKACMVLVSVAGKTVILLLHTGRI